MIDDQNFANLFRQTPEMVCILAGPEHRFEFVNEAHIRALGFDATGRAVREAQPESVEVHGILDEVYRTGVTAELREIAVTLTDRTRYFNLTYAARRSAEGEIDGIMILGSEVTEQVLARQAREQHIDVLARAQDRIQRSEDQLTLALESSKVGFYDWNVPEDSFTMSPRMRADWGIGDEPRKWTLGDLVEFIHPDDRARVQQKVAASLEERQPYHAEYRIVRPDGNVVWLDVRGKVTYSDDGKPLRFFGTTTDISERVAHERDLRSLADSMPQVVWAATPDGALDYTNQRWTDYSGSSDPTRWLDFVFPTEREQAAASWAASVASGKPYGTEFRLLRASDQTYRWHLVRAEPAFDAAGRVTRWFGTCTDIDDQKRSEDLFRILAEVSAVLSRAVDSDDYAQTIATVTRLAVPLVADWAAVDVLETGGGFRRLTIAHSDPEKLAFAEEVWRRWPPTFADATGVAQVVRSGTSEITGAVSDETLALDGSDPERAIAMRILGLKSSMRVPFYAREKVVGAITFGSAESGRRFTNSDLRFAEDFARRVGTAVDNAQLFRTALDARKVADEANRLKDEFLATISHELRTPLTSILGWARLLHDASEPARVKKGITVIERNAKAQAQLIEDILDVSRIVSGKVRLDMAKLEPAAVIGSAVETVRPLAEAKQQEIRVVSNDTLPVITADEDRLQQVVWNLLSNAVKFTPPGGHIEVQAQASGDSLTITVSDDGAGISAAFLPHVFDRFRQDDNSTTKQHAGLGLGLSIVRHLTELHGGSVTVTSAGLGKGASFSVILPLRPATPASVLMLNERLDPSQSNPEASRARLAGAKLLIVDDQDDARELIATVLADAGARVTQANTVHAALLALSQQPADLVISDIGMPEEDGYSFIARLRASPAPIGTLPALAVTAFARVEDRQRALTAGFNEHISKPIDPHALVEIAARFVAARGR